jgi:alkanesulfonate monooxygenase SsuD/methylene tetrahydromethanopterin reductase-like flavin-dependent oxidoreductase (luciferase family)
MSLLGGAHLPGTVADDGLSLVPRPAQAQVPVWVACDDDAGIERAATQGWGLMAAATHTPARVRSAVERYTRASGGREPELVLARFACTAATREEALAIARPYFESFVPRAQAQGWGADPKRSLARDVEALLAESLVGQHTEVAAQFRAMADRYGATRIAILPTSAQFDTHKHILADFVDEVRPMLEDD